jgi:hypothetical protein
MPDGQTHSLGEVGIGLGASPRPHEVEPSHRVHTLLNGLERNYSEQFTASSLRVRTGGYYNGDQIHEGGQWRSGNYTSGASGTGWSLNASTGVVSFEQAEFADGTVGAPSIAFSGDLDTGLYYDNGVMRWTNGGTTGGFVWSGGIRVVDGSAATPSYSFTADENTGFYKASGNDDDIQLSLAGSNAGGFRVQTYTPTFNTLTTSTTVGNGTAVGRYFQLGELLFVWAQFSVGSTTSLGTGVMALTLPSVASGNHETGGGTATGVGYLRDNSTTQDYPCHFFLDGGNNRIQFYQNINGETAVTSTSPFSFTTSDSVRFTAVIPLAL